MRPASPPAVEGTGVEEVMDLDFGRCKLQVQVPAKGGIESARDLVGKNIVTSFTGLTERYFRGLEEEGEHGLTQEKNAPLKTKIKYVGGSVEAACAPWALLMELWILSVRINIIILKF